MITTYKRFTCKNIKAATAKAYLLTLLVIGANGMERQDIWFPKSVVTKADANSESVMIAKWFVEKNHADKIFVEI